MGKYNTPEQPSLEGFDMYHEAHEALSVAYSMHPRDPLRISIEQRAQTYALLAVVDAIREANQKPTEIPDKP